MTKESQATIRRLDVLAGAYDAACQLERKNGTRDVVTFWANRVRSIRAAIKQIEMMEGE